jgi:hypothetical protein
MPAYKRYLPRTLTVDATLDENAPGVAAGASSGLILGNNKRIWITWLPGDEIATPAGAVNLAATLTLTVQVPVGAIATAITARKLLGTYSESTVTHTAVLNGETALTNWPAQSLGTVATIPARNPFYSGVYQTVKLDLNVLPFFTSGATGLLLEVAGTTEFPIASREQADGPVLTVLHGFLPHQPTVPEILNTTAIVEWPSSPGADAYVVQLSTDNTNWTRRAPVLTSRAELDNLVASTNYWTRIIAVYGNIETAPSASTKFTTSATGTPGSQLVAPGPPQLVLDSANEAIRVYLPEDPVQDIESWEISRTRGSAPPSSPAITVIGQFNYDAGTDPSAIMQVPQNPDTGELLALPGDLLLVFVNIIESGQGWSEPAGWDTVEDTRIGNSGLTIFSRTATANEPAVHYFRADIVASAGRTIACLLVLRGADVDLPIRDSNSSTVASPTLPTTTPGVTMQTGDYVVGAASVEGNRTITLTGGTSNLLSISKNTGLTASDRSLALAAAVAPSNGTATFGVSLSPNTNPNTTLAAVTVALNKSISFSSDTVATVLAGRIYWSDKSPSRLAASYQIRGKLRNSTLYTPWSVPVSSPNPTTPLRTNLLSPYTTLELSLIDTDDVAHTVEHPPAVETASPHRIRVSGGSQFELKFSFRSSLLASTDDVFRASLRWFDRTGVRISDTSVNTTLDTISGESPSGTRSVVGTAPGGADSLGLAFEIVRAGSAPLTAFPPATKSRIRIEDVELYQIHAGRDTGWNYYQSADNEGQTPDERDEIVDQTAFSYDGIGWGALTAAPAGATTGPYRETTTVDDELTFLNTGPSSEVLLYGTGADIVLSWDRLSDSPVLSQNQDDLWLTIPSIVGAKTELGPNLVQSPNSFNATVWGNSNPSGTSLATANGTDLIPGAGPDTFLRWYVPSGLQNADDHVWVDLTGYTFRASKTYLCSFRARAHVGPTGVDFTSQMRVTLGNFYPVPFHIFDSRIENINFYGVVSTIYSNPQTISFYWTPSYDTNAAVLQINPIINREDNSGFWDFTFNSVTLQEVIGHRISSVPNNQPVSIRTPPYFSPYNTTPYRLRLISGKLRPYGLRRSRERVVDFTSDFDTALRALGNLRNSSAGELEFTSSPTGERRVTHHQRRGRDHATFANSLDIRLGKNITKQTWTRTPGQIVNRLVLVGYGDDRTQLVVEVRAQKDRQGRLPSDPKYRYDVDGNAPTSPSWDVLTGGTSEEVYGIRYDTYRDANINTTYQAQDVGQDIVETAAWPTESTEVSLVDVGNVPADLDVGDVVYPPDETGHRRDRRVVEITTDIAKPREIQLVLGDNTPELPNMLVAFAKSIDTTLSFINSTTGAASTPHTG